MKQTKPLVSIIVPIYNIEEYVGRCIESIINQTYTNLEIILVDDGSLDSSPIICDEYGVKDKRIKTIHKLNGGLSDARNAGLDIATGDYITFIDGDDWYDKNAIEKLVNEAIGGELQIANMGMFSTNGDLDNAINLPLKKALDNSDSFIRKVCDGLSDVSVCSKLFSINVINGTRFIKGRLNEDFLFLCSILLERDVCVRTIEYCGYYYLRRPNSITHNPNRQSVLDAIDNCNELYERAIELNKNDFLPFFARMALHQACVAIIINPEYKNKKQSRYYTKGKECVLRYKKYIKTSALSKREKSICTFVSISPYFVAIIVNWLYRVKHCYD